MKKIFTLLSLVIATITSMAQTTTDYSCALAVLVNGNPADPQQKVVTTIEDNGKYTLQLKDFILYDGGFPMPVGTITVEGIDAVTVDGTTTLKTTQDITIASGSDDTQTWMGPFLQEVPITLDGTITNGVLKATLDIPFGELKINVFINSTATQVENSGFEDWHTATYSNKTSDEPNRWHSFMSSGGPLASAVAGNTHTYISDDVRPGSEGQKSVKLQSCSVLLGAVSANGTLTTGRLYAGNKTATNTDNHSFIDLSNTDVDGNGDPFYSKIEGRPDSLVVWLKFHPGSGNKNPQALVSAVLTDGTYYQDPENANTTYNNIAAKAYSNTIESNGEVWQRISLPFDYETYKANSVSPRALLVTISTCATPGGGSKSSSDPDVLYIDDFSLIYNSAINGISVCGKEIAGFDPKTTEYEVEVNNMPTASDFVCAKANDGQVVNVTIEENVAKVLVMSEDLKSFTTYTINIKVKAPVTLTISDALYSTLYYSDVALVVPENTKASTYKVTNGQLEESYTYYSTETIPAGVGVVVSASAAGDYTFAISSEAGHVDESNMLKGSDEDALTEGGDLYYQLSLNKNEEPETIGFYWAAENGAAFTNKAHKAYLALTAENAGGAKIFYMDGTTDGIDNMSIQNTANQPLYNISGQRVNKSYKGMVISNGKKYILK